MNAQLTSVETAKLALSNPNVMCSILSEARTYRFPGYWNGSAFRSHPCGIIVGTIKLTNDWHCDDYCSITITDGEGWRSDYCRESCAHGDPHPRPIGGTEIQVWSGCGRSGQWTSEAARVRMEDKIVEILTGAAEFIAAAKTEQEERGRREAETRRVAQANQLNAALAKI